MAAGVFCGLQIAFSEVRKINIFQESGKAKTLGFVLRLQEIKALYFEAMNGNENVAFCQLLVCRLTGLRFPDDEKKAGIKKYPELTASFLSRLRTGLANF